jgi:formylglycine-generating enzyme required for sulfatase activity
MGKYEVTEAEWDKVLTWALSNGYFDLAALYGKDLNHPVIFVSWYDILKWCNARSQMEGLTPVYYTDDAQTTIYKTGDVNVTNTQVKWSANGYRLPTEAEWEKAARGGLSGKRFPWGDTISHSEANYKAGDYYAWTHHPTYAVGHFPYTSPVGAFAANGYGLYDMAGNVAEWCWDRFGDYAAGNQTNPRGPTIGLYRAIRGGSWESDATSCEVAEHYSSRSPSNSDRHLGFRVLRNADSIDGNLAPTIWDIADQSITVGSNTREIAITIGDAQTAAGSLILSASSSNTSLVPSANIVFGGSGASRTVTVTPASGQIGTATITVTVSDGSLSASNTFLLTVHSPSPTGFALVPGGSFTMGDSYTISASFQGGYEPTRGVILDAFYMGKYEVSKAEWDEVRTWALSNGYTDLATGSGKASTHPVHSISWYDVVKWCNARSQMEGLTPVYYTNDAQTTVYKTGNVKVTKAQVKWSANGYRLPTEAEWEKAARGGLSGKRFPWGNTISQSQANYNAYSDNAYDVFGRPEDLSSSVNNFHPTYIYPTYETESWPYTSPVGEFAPNGYGLYDMVGNVSEWCWDWDGEYATGSQTNPRGAISGTHRVHRGGSWITYAPECRIYNRPVGDPTSTNYVCGFRVLRSLAP